MDEANLFGTDAGGPAGGDAAPRRPDLSAPPRLRRADRNQVCMQPICIDHLLADDHPARAVWAVVDAMDLSGFHDKIAARGSDPGRPALDPRVLVALWLYAAIEGVGTARELARLCEMHDAYRWILGGESINYHTLSDFRVGHAELLRQILVQMIATLVEKGLVDGTRAAQDGVRIRASAGKSSFRREERLELLHQEAMAYLTELEQQEEPAGSAREQAKRKADAADRLRRIEEAQAQVKQAQAAKDSRGNRKGKKSEPRASTTDPDARVMKMPNGGFNPAYNVQFAVDTESRAVVGVDVTNEGRDSAESEPMRQQVEQHTGKKVEEHLYDGGYVNLDQIDRAEQDGVKVYAPVPKKTADPHARKREDTDHTFAWRQRMATDEAKAIYKLRASTVETVNADITEHRGLRRMPVRGSPKVLTVVLWYVLAYNLQRFASQLTTARQNG